MFFKKNILVIEDENHLCSSIVLWLRTEGYDVSAAENGEIALGEILNATMDNEAFDLLILDIQMPKMNGLELIDQLKQRHIDIPILIITGYGDRDILRELIKRNCSDYLDKPFNENVLLLKVKALLNQEKGLWKEQKPNHEKH